MCRGPEGSGIQGSGGPGDRRNWEQGSRDLGPGGSAVPEEQGFMGSGCGGPRFPTPRTHKALLFLYCGVWGTEVLGGAFPILVELINFKGPKGTKFLHLKIYFFSSKCFAML